ncbi:hypothetical protein QFC24_003424 [Naganishia onofrii]|uniref:Uncharacterized protein n=1 Tax=Naganishia onofrii TaxID=1851511 RepID=A0ACC2XI08_9TREE|nr:hypothetical protein QFC24_003424 [Naganishia onofrii]
MSSDAGIFEPLIEQVADLLLAASNSSVWTKVWWDERVANMRRELSQAPYSMDFLVNLSDVSTIDMARDRASARGDLWDLSPNSPFVLQQLMIRCQRVADYDLDASPRVGGQGDVAPQRRSRVPEVYSWEPLASDDAFLFAEELHDTGQGHEASIAGHAQSYWDNQQARDDFIETGYGMDMEIDRQATPRPRRSSATSMPAVQEVQQQVEDFMATSLAMSDAELDPNQIACPRTPSLASQSTWSRFMPTIDLSGGCTGLSIIARCKVLTHILANLSFENVGEIRARDSALATPTTSSKDSAASSSIASSNVVPEIESQAGIDSRHLDSLTLDSYTSRFAAPYLP